MKKFKTVEEFEYFREIFIAAKSVRPFANLAHHLHYAKTLIQRVSGFLTQGEGL
jgi:cyclophilin family peptidyl-prolyl cis-trans isomerase